MSAVILDTETTDATDNARIIEFASTSIMPSPEPLILDWDSVTVAHGRYSSDRPISFGAMAAHHIIDEDLVGLQPFPGFDASHGIEYIVGHNIDFDWRMMGRPKVRRICTLALCRSLWPLADEHTLVAMVYFLSRDKSHAQRIARGAHSAAADVEMVLGVLLPEILLKLHPRANTWEALWILSEDARIPTVMSFGKHKGVPMGDVPSDYKRWLLNQPDVDPYLAIALRK